MHVFVFLFSFCDLVLRSSRVAVLSFLGLHSWGVCARLVSAVDCCCWWLVLWHCRFRMLRLFVFAYCGSGYAVFCVFFVSGFCILGFCVASWRVGSCQLTWTSRGTRVFKIKSPTFAFSSSCATEPTTSRQCTKIVSTVEDSLSVFNSYLHFPKFRSLNFGSVLIYAPFNL